MGLPLVREFDASRSVALFAALVCVLSAVAAGAAPALFSARANLNQVLKEGGRGGTSGGASHRLRSLLVISEVALAAVALAGAGLFARSFDNARKINPGFDSSGVLFARIFMDGTTLSAGQQADFALRLRRKLETEPGVQAAGYSDFTPLSTTAGPYNRVEPAGYVPAPGESMMLSRAMVAPGIFDLMRIPLLDGRDFRDEDETKAPLAMIVNQAFARRFFHGRTLWDARCASSRSGPPSSRWRTIAAISAPPNHRSRTSTFPAGNSSSACTSSTTSCAPPAIRGNSYRPCGATSWPPIRGPPRSTPCRSPNTPRCRSSREKVAAILMGTLGAMCLFLAALGLYSVMSSRGESARAGNRHPYGDGRAAQRRHRHGSPARDGAGPGGTGCGTAVAFAVARLVAAMLVGLSAADPATFAGTTLFLALVALGAAWLPAYRATRNDPMIALRQQ